MEKDNIIILLWKSRSTSLSLGLPEDELASTQIFSVPHIVKSYEHFSYRHNKLFKLWSPRIRSHLDHKLNSILLPDFIIPVMFDLCLPLYFSYG
jgi:hypothetical protein